MRTSRLILVICTLVGLWTAACKTKKSKVSMPPQEELLNTSNQVSATDDNEDKKRVEEIRGAIDSAEGGGSPVIKKAKENLSEIDDKEIEDFLNSNEFCELYEKHQDGDLVNKEDADNGEEQAEIAGDEEVDENGGISDEAFLGIGSVLLVLAVADYFVLVKTLNKQVDKLRINYDLPEYSRFLGERGLAVEIASAHRALIGTENEASVFRKSPYFDGNEYFSPEELESRFSGLEKPEGFEDYKKHIETLKMGSDGIDLFSGKQSIPENRFVESINTRRFHAIDDYIYIQARMFEGPPFFVDDKLVNPRSIYGIDDNLLKEYKSFLEEYALKAGDDTQKVRSSFQSQYEKLQLPQKPEIDFGNLDSKRIADNKVRYQKDFVDGKVKQKYIALKSAKYAAVAAGFVSAFLGTVLVVGSLDNMSLASEEQSVDAKLKGLEKEAYQEKCFISDAT